MKNKFVIAAAVAGSLALGVSGVASAQTITSSSLALSTNGETVSQCVVNGVEVPCDDFDVPETPTFELPALPDFDMSTFERPMSERPAFELPERPAFDLSTSELPTFDSSSFEAPSLHVPAFVPPTIPTAPEGETIVVTSTSSVTATNGETVSQCVVNGVEVDCDTVDLPTIPARPTIPTLPPVPAPPVAETPAPSI